jgi:hypothetical protein
VQREATQVRRDLDRSANGLQSEAEDLVERIRSIA